MKSIFLKKFFRHLKILFCRKKLREIRKNKQNHNFLLLFVHNNEKPEKLFSTDTPTKNTKTSQKEKIPIQAAQTAHSERPDKLRLFIWQKKDAVKWRQNGKYGILDFDREKENRRRGDPAAGFIYCGQA